MIPHKLFKSLFKKKEGKKISNYYDRFINVGEDKNDNLSHHIAVKENIKKHRYKREPSEVVSQMIKLVFWWTKK